MKKSLDVYLFYYFFILLIFSYIFLFTKHEVGNDSTISEWFINYEGGFTKRGIVGQIAIELSRYFQTSLRWTIFILQTLTVTLYFSLLFNFLKKLKFERIIILSIFTPIFILYPVAEIEVLARKEIIVFSLFLIYLLIPRSSSFKLFSLVFFLTLSMLIWEPVIFFFPLILVFEIIENNIQKFDLNLIKIISSFIPSLIIALIIIFNPLNGREHEVMALVLKNEFSQDCYMSCDRILSVKISDNIQQVTDRYSFEVFLRYSLIIIIGFFPLGVLFKNSYLKNNKLFIFKYFGKPINTFFIALLPITVLFAMAFDWGRWVNISYVFLALIYFQLILNNYLILDIKKLRQNFLYKIKGVTFVTFFIIFCFGWNPKTAVSGDVASFPGYRIPYNIFKILSN